METIEPKIKEYIETAFDKFKVEFIEFKSDLRAEIKQQFKQYAEDDKKEYHRHMSDLRFGFEVEVKKLSEIVSSRPDRDEMRSLLVEVLRPYVTEQKLVISSVSDLNSEVDNHEKRITKLEPKTLGPSL